MASGPSILATLGVDIAPLKRDLATAEKVVEQSTGRMERAQAKGFKKLGGGIGGAFGFAQDVIGSFGLAGGVGAAISLLIPKFAELREESKKSEDALEWLLMPVQAASHSNEQDLLSRIEAINEELKKTSVQPNVFSAAFGGFTKGLDEMFGGTSDQTSPDSKAARLLAAREKAQERLAEVRDLQKQVETRKDMNQKDAESQKAGIERRKELSDLLDKQAADAIKNINQEKSAEIELGNIRSEQEGTINDQLEKQKQLEADILDHTKNINAQKAQGIAAAKQSTKDAMREEFINDPSAHGENERRREARRRERRGAQFDRRTEHEIREDQRRGRTGARVVGEIGPNASARGQAAFEATKQKLVLDAAEAVLRMEKTLKGKFTNE